MVVAEVEAVALVLELLTGCSTVAEADGLATSPGGSTPHTTIRGADGADGVAGVPTLIPTHPALDPTPTLHTHTPLALAPKDAWLTAQVPTAARIPATIQANAGSPLTVRAAPQVAFPPSCTEKSPLPYLYHNNTLPIFSSCIIAACIRWFSLCSTIHPLQANSFLNAFRIFFRL